MNSGHLEKAALIASRSEVLAVDITTQSFAICQMFIIVFISQTWKLRHKILILS